MWLQVRMYLLLGLMFAIMYGLLIGAGAYIGIGGFAFYAALAFVLLLIQYLIGPSLIEKTMGVEYVSKEQEPELHSMVEELAQNAGIEKPRVCVSNSPIPNAFAFGRTISDSRVCVTKGIMSRLNKGELKAVLGHEVSHIKNRDVMVMTLLSIVPMIAWYMAFSFMFSGSRKGNALYLGIAAFAVYFITNLLVLYGSRIREYYADKGSVELGNRPHQLASALYKLVHGSASVSKEKRKQAEGYKAFFLNDPSKADSEINELKDLDMDMDGSVDESELKRLKSKDVKHDLSDRLMEFMSTHPRMLPRIQYLSRLEP